MSDPLIWHRLQFAFTVIYHYLFPQLTMGLALLIVIMKAVGLRTGDRRWDAAARFWIRIFRINFAIWVVTGIPMELQLGTNWAAFSRFAGGVVGQTLAMEGMFAFFLESSFLGLLAFGERRLSRRGHFLAALALFFGSWLSGYFIVCTNAFLQHPSGQTLGPGGNLELADFWSFVLNPWALAQYAHTMMATVVTASFVVAAVGAWYALLGRHRDQAARFLRVGTLAGLIAAAAVAFPTTASCAPRQGQPDRSFRNGALHVDRVRRALFRPRPPVPLLDRARDRPRTRVAEPRGGRRRGGGPWLSCGLVLRP
jgi:cytochrome d ubiquinol oxidase subunit I